MKVAMGLASILVLLIAAISLNEARAAPEDLMSYEEDAKHIRQPRVEGPEDGMRDAIRYLEEMDKYYSQVARPRFGKRFMPRSAPYEGPIPRF